MLTAFLTYGNALEGDEVTWLTVGSEGVEGATLDLEMREEDVDGDTVLAYCLSGVLYSMEEAEVVVEG